MRDAGWTGVPSSAFVESRSTGAERGASSPSVPNLTKRGSADSGYSDGNTPSSDPDANGYFSGWNKLKKAVWDTGEVNGPCFIFSRFVCTWLSH